MTTQAAVKPLSSDWTGLNPNLIATFRAVKREKVGDQFQWIGVPGSPVVAAPITEANIEHTINWQSPFENVGADQRFSSLSALLQTGALAPLGMLWDQFIRQIPDSVLQQYGVNKQAATSALTALEGKSSVTKLNSTQVFNGLPPMKISFTAHFRAEVNPQEEVEQPLSQLIAWALPKSIVDDGILAQAAQGKAQSPWPSETPTIIGMQYAGRSFMPLVIESVPYPLSAPRDPNGRMLSAQIPMVVASLSAWDANDWNRSYMANGQSR